MRVAALILLTSILSLVIWLTCIDLSDAEFGGIAIDQYDVADKYADIYGGYAGTSTTTTAKTLSTTSAADVPDDLKKWKKSLSNPVMTISPKSRGTDDVRFFDEISVGEPVIIKDAEDGIYKMWYSAGDGTSNDGSLEDDITKDPGHRNDVREGFNKYIGYAYSVDGNSWTKYYDPNVVEPSDKNPRPATAVLTPTPNSYDEGGCISPTVLKDGSVYRMWYVGIYFAHESEPDLVDCESGDPVCPNFPNEDHPYIHSVTRLFALMYAESPDGIHWEKHGPVEALMPNAELWFEYGVWGPDVIKDGTDGSGNPLYKLYFTAIKSQIVNTYIREDGQFRNHDPVEAEWDGTCDYYCFYLPNLVRNFTDSFAIGMKVTTTPSDGTSWVDPDFTNTGTPAKPNSNPIWSGYYNQWDATNRLANLESLGVLRFHAATEVSVLKDPNTNIYYMFYHGSGLKSQIGFVYSKNGIDWTYDEALGHGSRMIVDKGKFYTWEGGGVRAPSVILDDNLFRLWYMGIQFENGIPQRNNYNLSGIGYAQIHRDYIISADAITNLFAD
jgi:hypothetical protein